MQFCHITGCPGIAKTGVFCEQHKSPTARTERSRSDPWYSRKEWRGRWGIRRFKLKRNPMCEVCNVNRATQVHHLKDEWRVTRDWFLFMGGYNMEFLQSLCAKCHSEITMNQIKARGIDGLTADGNDNQVHVHVVRAVLR